MNAKLFIKDGYIYAKTPYNAKYLHEIREIKSRRWRNPYNIVKITSDKIEANLFMEITKRYYNTPILDLPDVGFGIAKYVKKSKFAESILFITDYNADFVASVKSKNAKWNSDKVGWELPIHTINAIENIYNIMDKYGIVYENDSELILVKKYNTLKLAHNKKQELINMSQKSDSVGIVGINTPNGIKLYPYQQVGVNYITENPNKGILIADDTGLGKTAQALTYCYNNPNCYPVLIIVPNCVKINWKREIKTFCNSDSVEIISGITPYKFPKVEFVVINYDILNRTSKNSKKTWSNVLSRYGFKTIIMDEVHYIKNPKSKRTQACYDISLSPSITKKIALSATPMMNKPIELLPILRTLEVSHPDLETDYLFKNKYCYNGQINGYTSWDGAQNMDELNIMLRETCMIRRLIDNVLPELPEKLRTPISIDIENRNEYNDAENHFIEWYKEIKDKSIQSNAETLVKIENLRQLAVLGKMKNTIEYIENILESKDKLIIFAHHRKIQQMLFNHFKKQYKVAQISGGMTLNERTENEKYFQDGEANLIICSIKAANTGINLQISNTMIFVELDFIPSTIIQAEGRNRRIGSNSKFCQYHYIVASDTIEEKMLSIISYKQKLIDQAIDGITEENNENIFNELLETIIGD